MTDIIEYIKIPGPFRREVSGPNKNKVISWAWTSEELKELAEIRWVFTEKIDGTNIRVVWDGHKPEFRGRTDKANLPTKLLASLTEMFPEELFEQQFGSTPVILFGEGYGAGIQKGGGNYRKDNSFILFDVCIGDWWLKDEDVVDIAVGLGIDYVPVRFAGTLTEAIRWIAEDRPIYSQISESTTFEIEGVVGTPLIPLFRRDGSRIIVKLKGCDLRGLELD